MFPSSLSKKEVYKIGIVLKPPLHWLKTDYAANLPSGQVPKYCMMGRIRQDRFIHVWHHIDWDNAVRNLANDLA